MKRIGIGIAAALIVIAVALALWRGTAEPPAAARITGPTASPAPETPAAAPIAPAAATAPQPTPEPSPTAAPAESAEVTYRLRGRVVSAATGEPIAGAQVEQVPFRRADPALHATATDASGEYELPLTKEVMGTTTVVVRAEGHASASRRIPLLEPAGNQLDFVLAAGGAIRGRVVDAEGAPVAGAWVGAKHFTDPGGSAENGYEEVSTPSSRARSGEDGAFALEGLPAGAEIRFPVSADGFLAVLTQPIRVGTEDARIVLPRGDATLAGTVYLGDGKDRPLAGVRVSFSDPAAVASATYIERVATNIFADTDADGRFSARLASGMEYAVAAWTDEGGLQRAGRTRETLAPDETREIEIHIREVAAFTIRGRVYARATKQPVAGARVIAMASGAANLRTDAISGADGRYELAILGEMGGAQRYANYFVECPPGWLYAPDYHGTTILDFSGRGNSAEVDFPLDEALAMRGVVLDGSRKPAPGATLTLDNGGQGEAGTCDAEGRFSIAVPIGRAFKVEARSGEASALREFGAIASGEDLAEQEFVLSAHAAISGVLVDEQGTPIEGAGFRLTQMLDSRRKVIFDAFGVATDAEGRFAIRDLKPGKLELELNTAAGDAKRYRLKEKVSLELAAGQEIADLRLVATLGGFIEGRVVDQGGNAVGDAMVHASFRDDASAVGQANVYGKSGADGTFRIDGIREDATRIRINAQKPGFRSGERTVASIFDGAVEITLKAVEPYHIIALDAETDAPVTRYEWRFQSQFDLGNTEAWKRVEDAEGRSAVQTEVPQKELVEVREVGPDGTPTGRAGERLLEREPNGHFQEMAIEGDITVRVAGPVEVTGRVLQADRRAAAGATVTATRALVQGGFAPPLDASLGEATADASGRFRLRLPAGMKVNLRAQLGELSVRSEQFVVGTPESRDIELVLAEGGTVRVRAEDGEGAPVVGVAVVLIALGNMQAEARTAETDASGMVEFKGLENGTYMVRASRPQSHPGVEEVHQVSVNQSTELVRVVFGGTVRVRARLTVNGAAPPRELSSAAITAKAVPGQSGGAMHMVTIAPDGSFEADLPIGMAAVLTPISEGELQLGPLVAEATVPDTDGAEMRFDLSAGTIRIAGWKAIREASGKSFRNNPVISTGDRQSPLRGLKADPATGDSEPILVPAGIVDIFVGNPPSVAAMNVQVDPGASLRVELQPFKE